MFEIVVASLVITAGLYISYQIGYRAGEKAEFLRVMIQVNPIKVAKYIAEQEEDVRDSMFKMASKIVKWIGEVGWDGQKESE